jgi:GT2 family glycosyltransferase
MVASVRTNLHVNTSYEIIVVDGGSEDGTQAWCLQQPDVVLHEGNLDGAIPNFNKGFSAVAGRYVCQANDDIEFVGDSLQLALDYMRNHPRCGAGCIPHARGTKEPWVSLINVSLGGLVRRWPMCQVGIIPKWLGDQLGWWGTYTAHYHGDQLLSRRLWEEGFTVSVVPDAWLRDFCTKDALRERNADLGRGRKDARVFRAKYPTTCTVKEAPVLTPPFETVDPNRPDVDIVMGTYNRVELLQHCIEYARQAATGLIHRFIVVDGGSNDGTLEWLREQPDVMLVETGVLDGAVRAFNRGFARATADYVVHINDDMAIVEGTLRSARDYLAANADVGQVAFPTAVGNEQEFKNHNCWHKDNVFANFGMVKRWLGNYVSWWGFWTHKYFGDVHLSLRLHELGYKVVIFPQVKCRDFLPADDLRGADDNARCKQDGRDFDTAWPYRRNVKGSPPFVPRPGGPLVQKASFE